MKPTQVVIRIDFSDNTFRDFTFNTERRDFNWDFSDVAYILENTADKIADLIGNCFRDCPDVVNYEVLSVDGYEDFDKAQEQLQEEHADEIEDIREEERREAEAMDFDEREESRWLASQGRPIFAGL